MEECWELGGQRRAQQGEFRSVDSSVHNRNLQPWAAMLHSCCGESCSSWRLMAGGWNLVILQGPFQTKPSYCSLLGGLELPGGGAAGWAGGPAENKAQEGCSELPGLELMLL